MGFLRKDHVMGVLEDDKVGTMACYESKQERDIVKFCYDSMEHVLDRLPQYRPDNVYKDAKDTNVPGKWIPISERLPSKPLGGEDGYVVQDMCVIEPFSAYWDGEKWTDDEDYVLDYIIAWMPLPEPYREVTDEENLESRR